MWLDRVHSFVKAGKVFNHNVFLILYHSCYTPHKCEYVQMITTFTSFFFMFPTSLSYSHILHTVLEHKWRCCFDLNELQANTTGPVCTGPYTRMELCSREGSVCKDGLGSGWSCSHQQNPILYYSASAAVTRKGQFLLSLLTVSNVLIRQKNLSLLSGSHWREPSPGQLGSARSRCTLSASAGKSCSVLSLTETGIIEVHRGLPNEAGRHQTLEAMFHIIANYAFIL